MESPLIISDRLQLARQTGHLTIGCLAFPCMDQIDFTGPYGAGASAMESSGVRMSPCTSRYRRPVMGPEHPMTLLSMDNLAWDLDQLGNPRKAEAFESQTLAIERRAWGPESRSFESTDVLALILKSETKYTQVLALYKQMLAVRPRVLGPDHPKVIQSLGELLSTTQLWVNSPECRGLADHGNLFAAPPCSRAAADSSETCCVTAGSLIPIFLIVAAVHLMRRRSGLVSSRQRCALTPRMRTEV
jgi:Tetratricopeptide repeat